MSVSSELKEIFEKLVKEKCRNNAREVEERLRNCNSLLIDIAKHKKLEFPIWIEESEENEFKQQEKDLDLLEKSGLVAGQTNYTARTPYREYEITSKGTELVKTLSDEH